MLVRSNVANRPESRTLLHQASFRGKNILFELFQMLYFTQKCGSIVSFDKLSIKVGWILYCFVLFRQNLYSKYNRVKEEVAQHGTTLVLWPILNLFLKNKVDSIFHYVESTLLAISGQSISHLFVNLRHRPRWHLIWPTFWINKSCS